MLESPPTLELPPLLVWVLEFPPWLAEPPPWLLVLLVPLELPPLALVLVAPPVALAPPLPATGTEAPGSHATKMRPPKTGTAAMAAIVIILMETETFLTAAAPCSTMTLNWLGKRNVPNEFSLPVHNRPPKPRFLAMQAVIDHQALPVASKWLLVVKSSTWKPSRGPLRGRATLHAAERTKCIGQFTRPLMDVIRHQRSTMDRTQRNDRADGTIRQCGAASSGVAQRARAAVSRSIRPSGPLTCVQVPANFPPVVQPLVRAPAGCYGGEPKWQKGRIWLP